LRFIGRPNCGQSRALLNCDLRRSPGDRQPDPWHTANDTGRFEREAKTGNAYTGRHSPSPQCQLRPRILRHHRSFKAGNAATVCLIDRPSTASTEQASARCRAAYEARRPPACRVCVTSGRHRNRTATTMTAMEKELRASLYFLGLGRRCCSPPALSGQRVESNFALPAAVEQHRRRSPPRVGERRPAEAAERARPHSRSAGARDASIRLPRWPPGPPASRCS